MKAFGKRLRAVRIAAGMRQRDICKYTNLSNSFLSDVERGKRGISAANLLLLSRALGLSMDQLFTGKVPE